MFEAYPIVFTNPHHFSPGVAGLTFLPIALGGVISVTLVMPSLLTLPILNCLTSCQYVSIFNPRYEREAKRRAPDPVPPEFRLEMALISGPIFALSFFWFG